MATIQSCAPKIRIAPLQDCQSCEGLQGTNGKRHSTALPLWESCALPSLLYTWSTWLAWGGRRRRCWQSYSYSSFAWSSVQDRARPSMRFEQNNWPGLGKEAEQLSEKLQVQGVNLTSKPNIVYTAELDRACKLREAINKIPHTGDKASLDRCG